MPWLASAHGNGRRIRKTSVPLLARSELDSRASHCEVLHHLCFSVAVFFHKKTDSARRTVSMAIAILSSRCCPRSSPRRSRTSRGLRQGIAATPTYTFLCYCPLESSAIVMWLLSMRSRAFRNGSPTAGPRPLFHGHTRCGCRAGASIRSRRQTRSHCDTLISRFRSSIHHPSQFP